MGTMSVARDVGVDGIKFLRKRLAEGGGLSKSLLSRGLDSGTVKAWVPEGTSKKRACAFEVGGLLPRHHAVWHAVRGGYAEEVKTYDEEMAKVIAAHLVRGHGYVCVLEDELAMPGDANLRGAGPTLRKCGREVYRVLSGPTESEPGGIIQAIRSARGAAGNLLGALTSTGERCAATFLDGQLTEECLEDFAMRATAIVAAAYDGESFVIWRETSREA